jgi:hypothetical protein
MKARRDRDDIADDPGAFPTYRGDLEGLAVPGPGDAVAGAKFVGEPLLVRNKAVCLIVS